MKVSLRLLARHLKQFKTPSKAFRLNVVFSRLHSQINRSAEARGRSLSGFWIKTLLRTKQATLTPLGTQHFVIKEFPVMGRLRQS